MNKEKINPSIKLIIGLGNPEARYKNTYHNAGFLTIDYFAKNPLNHKLFRQSWIPPFLSKNSNSAPGQIINCKLLKSESHMNNSGFFVHKKVKKYGLKPKNLLIIHDDSDIELGKYKISFGRGAAGHKGIESIIKSLKSKNFWRLRVGIRPAGDRSGLDADSRTKNLKKKQRKRMKAGEFVLKKINATDKKILSQTFKKMLPELSKLSAPAP